MALPHSGSLNRKVILLRVETNLFDLYIEGKPYHPTVDLLNLHRNEDREWTEAHFNINALSSSLDVQSVSVFSPVTGELMPWQSGEPSYPIFFETQSYDMLIEKKQEMNLTFYHENINLREAVNPKGKSILSGSLKFQNEVGYTEMELRLDSQRIFEIRMEIFPVKMDYKNDYQTILKDVNEQIYNLSFDFLRKTYQLTGLKETSYQSLTEFFTILQHIFQQLMRAMDRIQVSPHSKLHQDQRVVETAKAKKLSNKTTSYLARRPHLLVKSNQHGMMDIQGDKYYPTHVLESRRLVNYDTMENRFIRWVFIRINKKLDKLQEMLNLNGRMQDPLLSKKIHTMQTEIRRILKLDFLQVGDMKQMSISLVLQMAPGYREVYRYYLMLMKGLAVQNDLFHLSLKDLAQLYEYWCFLKIHQLLSKKYELVKQNIIKVDHSGIFVTLKKSKASTVTFRNPKNGEIFKLYYNSHHSGPTLSQKPDNILTLRKKDTATEYKYVFDAKYRMNPAEVGTSYHNAYKKPGPEEDDINTMHRYRDAIVHIDGAKEEYERSMFGAYILFPYPNEDEFEEHHFYRSISKVNVGAIPFLPNSTRIMEEFLDEIILDSPEKAYERSTRPLGTKEYYDNKFGGNNVLVGCMSREEQLKVAMDHKFYHTPLKNITDHRLLTQLEYVALYQSIKFFGKKGEAGVTKYGKITNWKVVKRGEITEIESKHNSPDELYVVFEIEAWLDRQERIVPGGHGVKSIVYTSKYMFDRAQEIAELKLETEEQLQEWREKRRRGKIKVQLDHEFVDLAGSVVSMGYSDE